MNSLLLLVSAWGVAAITWSVAGGVSATPFSDEKRRALRWLGLAVLLPLAVFWIGNGVRGLSPSTPDRVQFLWTITTALPVVAWIAGRPRLAGLLLCVLAVIGFCVIPLIGALMIPMGVLGLVSLNMARGFDDSQRRRA